MVNDPLTRPHHLPWSGSLVMVAKSNIALLLAIVVLQQYIGGKWLAPCGGCIAMNWLMQQWGWSGGLMDLMPNSRLLWVTAAALALMIVIGPIR